MTAMPRFTLKDVLLLLLVVVAAAAARVGYLLACLDDLGAPAPLAVQEAPALTSLAATADGRPLLPVRAPRLPQRRGRHARRPVLCRAPLLGHQHRGTQRRRAGLLPAVGRAVPRGASRPGGRRAGQPGIRPGAGGAGAGAGRPAAVRCRRLPVVPAARPRGVARLALRPAGVPRLRH